MLSIVGKPTGRYCDGVRRRDFLKIGAMGLGFSGLNLAGLLKLEAATGTRSSTKSIINIHLGGGPPHQDMWDLKPNAPIEYRGEFNPIATKVPGLEICELFPQLAAQGDRFAVIRSLMGMPDEHSANMTQTGYSGNDLKSIGGAPTIGSIIAKLQGFNGGVAPFVSTIGLGPGYLGPKYRHFDAGGARELLSLNRISAERLTNRAELLKQVDSIRRDIDASGQLDAADTFTQQAVDVVLSGKMAEALDVEKEPQVTRDRYVGDGQGNYGGNRNILLARRLVEAGVRCVSLELGGWDTHGQNFVACRNLLPALDTGLSALLDDLYDRGMDQDVSVVVWGEFGRTPRINPTAGRDHWARVGGAFIAGGGMKMGQAIGASDRIAGEPAERPVHVQEVIATLYHNVGIDPRTTQLIDPAGRPRYLLDHREPVAELVG